MANVPAIFFVQNFRSKFEFEGEGINNFFLNEINIYLGAPLDDLGNGIEVLEGF